MSENPYIQFYTSDFLGGTGGMTAAQKGVYITLLCLMYESEEPVTQSWGTLARRCGCTLTSFRKAVDALVDDGKLDILDGALWSDKCERHIALRRERSHSAKAAAKKRWKKDKQKQRQDDANALSPHCQPEPEPEYSDTDVSDGNAVDVTEVVWTKCKDWLVKCGQSDANARRLIGLWLKGNSPERVRTAFKESWLAKTEDPVPYITKILQPKQNGPSAESVSAVIARALEGKSA